MSRSRVGARPARGWAPFLVRVYMWRKHGVRLVDNAEGQKGPLVVVLHIPTLVLRDRGSRAVSGCQNKRHLREENVFHDVNPKIPRPYPRSCPPRPSDSALRWNTKRRRGAQGLGDDATSSCPHAAILGLELRRTSGAVQLHPRPRG